MKSVRVVAPEGHEFPGTVHTIPEADLEGFMADGWVLEEEEKQPSKGGNKNK